MPVNVNMRQLLEAGVHYGHQCRRWNPKMNRFIFGARNGIHIIDLQKTVSNFRKAVDFVEETVANGGHILFVGTKRQSREIIAEEAGRSGQYFMNYRWLGGTLTNFPTMRQSIHKLRKIEKMSKDGTYEKLTKKEALNMDRLREKLDLTLGGVKDMPGMPDVVFITDANKETIAISEAKKLGIPIVAIADTNADPDGIDFPIPGNDDSVKSLKLFISTIAEACLAGKTRGKDKSEMTQNEQQSVKDGAFYDQEGRSVKVEKKPGN